jgi:hypothetical protein
MSATERKLPVKVGLGKLNKPMTKSQAMRWGNQNMPRDLKKAGFTTSVFQSDAEIHGGEWLRINYGLTMKRAA